MKTSFASLIGIALLVWGITPQSMAQSNPPEYPTAATVDFSDPESVANAMLGVISGPAGEARDWELWRALHLPNSTSYALVKRPDTTQVVTIAVEDFIERNGPWYEENGFWEYQTDIKVDRFQNVATVYQNYEIRVKWDGPVNARGVNVHLMMLVDGKWRIASSAWDNEWLVAPGQ